MTFRIFPEPCLTSPENARNFREISLERASAPLYNGQRPLSAPCGAASARQNPSREPRSRRRVPAARRVSDAPLPRLPAEFPRTGARPRGHCLSEPRIPRGDSTLTQYIYYKRRLCRGTTTRRRPRRLAKRLSEVPGFTQGFPDRLSRSRRRSLPSADGASRSGEPKVQRTRKSVVEPGGTLMLKCSEDSEENERTQYAAPCFQRNCFSGSFQVKQRGFGTILCLEIAAVSPVRRRSSERATFERILPRRRAEYGCK